MGIDQWRVIHSDRSPRGLGGPSEHGCDAFRWIDVGGFDSCEHLGGEGVEDVDDHRENSSSVLPELRWEFSAVSVTRMRWRPVG
ncbi:hypothetical protein E1161_14720 [Saccharopolyspora aridisoli]|uniref:Uncharacterized protein n=1 Tax=Saccharopolyspora aridisoli TaxID=2530385 RepID=A0A4R4UR51_9PSEU|nr:hypothetical protein [Saccharopolyspora aridisoli]TDC91812.1 hypothetical protein E1161_14720 [Saccharopolyspora aridisoli]